MRDRPDHRGAVRARLTDVRAVLEALDLLGGYKPEKNGSGFVVRCPAHGDKTPSCSVRIGPDRTIQVKCFGCDLAGDVFTLVAAARGLDVQRDFAHVLADAAELAHYDLGVDARDDVPRLVPAVRPVPPAPNDGVSLEDFDRLARIVLDACPVEGDDDVREYLRARLLLAGARDDKWAALPAEAGKRRAIVARIVEVCGRETWEKSGLAQGDDFTFSEHRIVIPWRAPDGRVVTMQRRALDSRQNKYVFAKGRSPAWPYGCERLADALELPVLLVEGAADVLAVRELLEPGSIATIRRPYVPIGVPGVATWKDAWSSLLVGRLLCIGFDRDKAGEDQAPRLAKSLQHDGLRFADPWRIKPSKTSTAKDWGALLESRIK